MLNNKSSGVFFNDSTKILLDVGGSQFYYFERKVVSNSEKQDVMTTHSLNNYPKEL